MYSSNSQLSLSSPITDTESLESPANGSLASPANESLSSPTFSKGVVIKLILICIKLVSTFLGMYWLQCEIHTYGSKAYPGTDTVGEDLDLLACLSGGGDYHLEFLEYLLEYLTEMFGTSCKMHVEHFIHRVGVTIPFKITMIVDGVSIDLAFCFYDIVKLHEIVYKHDVNTLKKETHNGNVVNKKKSQIEILNSLYQKCGVSEDFLSLFVNNLLFVIKSTEIAISNRSSAYSIFPLFLVLDVNESIGESSIGIFVKFFCAIKNTFKGHYAYGSPVGHLSGGAIIIMCWYIYMYYSINGGDNHRLKHLIKNFWDFYCNFQWKTFYLTVKHGQVIVDIHNSQVLLPRIVVYGGSCVTQNVNLITFEVISKIMCVCNEKKINVMKLCLPIYRFHGCVYECIGDFNIRGLSKKLYDIARQINNKYDNYGFYDHTGKHWFLLYIYPISFNDGIAFGSEYKLSPNSMKYILSELSRVASRIFNVEVVFRVNV